jgi:hypothetical protein
MSAIIETEKRRLLWSTHPLLLNLLAPLLLAVAGAGVTVWVTQARTADRLSVAESKIEVNKAEREQQFRELREHTIAREEFSARWEDVKGNLQRIEGGINEIRVEQLRQARQVK